MIYFKDKKLDSVDELYAEYSKAEFKSPFRSTIPLILLFKKSYLQKLEVFSFNEKDKIKYTFEYKVPVRKGKGKDSYTDLMIITENSSIAIEAKSTEPKYETVGKWLGNSDNKKLVLDWWLQLIEFKTGVKVEQKKIKDLPYQLIHRTASACYLKKKQTSVIYLGFDIPDNMINYYTYCLNKISKILSNKIDFYFITYNIQKYEEQQRLENLWKSGERNLSSEIINCFKSNDLMDFKLLQLIKIND